MDRPSLTSRRSWAITYPSNHCVAISLQSCKKSWSCWTFFTAAGKEKPRTSRNMAPVFRGCPSPGWRVLLSRMVSRKKARRTPRSQRQRSRTAAVFPGFEVIGVLGRGGMGMVYKARDLRLKRLVALKVILAGEHANEQERARFKAEAETLAALQHPNIVQIHEVGAHDGKQFLSLEYCTGGSLDVLLQGTPLPPAPRSRRR